MRVIELARASAAIRSLVVAALVVASSANGLAAEGPAGRPIAVPARTTPVDFETDVLPLLRKNCLACHNARDNEAGVVLDSAAAIHKGGDSGALVAAGKAGDSLLLKVAAHQTDSVMPPAENKVGAVALNSNELGLLKLWIDQGAKAGSTKSAEPIARHPLPGSFRPMLAMSIAPDDDLVALSRGPLVQIYDLRGPRFVATLSDPAISSPGYPAADTDLVRSLAFDKSGDWLASGGFRTVRLWKRPRPEKQAETPLVFAKNPTVITTSRDGRTTAVGDAGGTIELRSGEAKPLSLAGHKQSLSALALTPKAETLYSASPDKTLRMWSTADGQLLATWNVSVEVRSLEISAEGDRLIAGGADGVIRVWVISSLRDSLKAETLPAPAVELKGHDQPVVSLSTAPEQKDRLLSGGDDGRLRWWSLSEAKVLRLLSHDAKILAVSVNADGTRFLSVGAQSARLWNAVDGGMIAEIKGDFRATRDLQRADGRLFDAKACVEYRKQEVREAEEALKRETTNLEGAQKARETAEKSVQEKTVAAAKAIEARVAEEAKEAEAVAAFKAADEMRTSAQATANDADAEVKKANQAIDEAKAAVAKDKENADLVAKLQQAEANLAVAKAKKQAADADLTRVTGLYRTAERSRQEAVRKADEARNKARDPERQLRDAQEMLIGAKNFIQTQTAILEKAKANVPLAKNAQTTAEGRVAESDKQKQALAATKPPAFASGSFSPGGGQFVLSAENGTLLLFSSDKGLPIDAVDRPGVAAVPPSYRSESGLLTVGEKSSLVSWTLNSGWQLARTLGNENDPTQLSDRVLSIDFSPDGKHLATAGGVAGSRGELKIWDAATGSLIREIPAAHSDTIHGVRYSPDGHFVATAAADKLVKIFRVDDGSLVQTLAGHSQYVLGVAWSSDGKSLVSGGADQVVKLWDLEKGAAKRTYRGTAYRIGEYRRAVTSVMFLPETEHFLASAGDRTVRLHRTSNDYDVRAYKDERAFFHAAVITRDGKTVLAGGQDGTLHAWHGESGYRSFSFTAEQPEQLIKPQ